jgi:DNA-binding MarR family transcriptional regulator
MPAADPSVRRARDALETVAFGAVAITTRAVAAGGVDLTFPQWRVLVIVGEDAGGASVTRIAERLGAEISPVSRLVTRMARSGFVSTAKDPSDRRVTRVVVTERGRAIRESVLAGRRRELTEVLASIAPIAPAEIDALRRVGEALRSRG